MEYIEVKTTWVIDSETEIQLGDEVEIKTKNEITVKGEVTILADDWLEIEVNGPGTVNVDIENIEEIERVE